MEACKSTSSTTDKKVNRTYLGLSLYGVEPREPWVQFGPQLEQQLVRQSERERRFPPRLVGYYVIRGYGFECVSLLYFKGEVILRLVSDGVKTVTSARPALSYWEAGGESAMWVKTRVIGAKPFLKRKGCHDDEIPLFCKDHSQYKAPGRPSSTSGLSV